LFHIIVDDDSIAAYLIKQLDARKGGRLTFLPLNRLHHSEIHYPPKEINEIKALKEVAIEYHPDFEAAMKDVCVSVPADGVRMSQNFLFFKVFGKKLLAKDLESASLYSKEFNMDAVTKDGDIVNRRGGFEGGNQIIY
jgi:structural maintenance of chromosome 3 (chondroitin sulfate proteoglycan 6)